MKCPVCEEILTEDTTRCSCGFYLDLAVEPPNQENVPEKKEIPRTPKQQEMSDVAQGIIWAILGVLMFTVFYFLSGLDGTLKLKFLTVSFLITIFGIYRATMGESRFSISKRLSSRLRRY